MAKVDRELVEAVRSGLGAAGDPTRATAQQAYMKSDMPYAGVTVPDMRRLVRAAAADRPLGSYAAWRDTILALWREATVREERYAAAEVAGLPRYRAHALRLDSLPVYEELIVDGAWWDHVDTAAIHQVGPLLLEHPGNMAPVIRAWASDSDRWRRRSSVICQIGAGSRVDTDLLAHCIEANVADPDFFLRKGIGWALRQHARVDPEWVRAFADAHPLSPVSRREALKHIG
jgi:3-methyladenine DNA glycosylase AlkD